MCSTEPALQALAKIFLNMMLTNLKVKESGVQKKIGLHSILRKSKSLSLKKGPINFKNNLQTQLS